MRFCFDSADLAFIIDALFHSLFFYLHKFSSLTFSSQYQKKGFLLGLVARSFHSLFTAAAFFFLFFFLFFLFFFLFFFFFPPSAFPRKVVSARPLSGGPCFSSADIQAFDGALNQSYIAPSILLFLCHPLKDLLRTCL